MRSYYDKIVFDGNTIIELSREYVTGSVSASYVVNSMQTTLGVEEIGEKYVSLILNNIDVPIGSTIQINYQIKSEYSKLSEIERLKALEKKIEEHEKTIQQLLEGMRTRVDIQTFNTWLKSVETQLGIDIVAQQFYARNK